MSEELLVRCIYGGIAALITAFAVFFRFDEGIGTEVSEPKHQRYLPYLNYYMLPHFLLIISVLGMIDLGFHDAAGLMLSCCFSIFLQISIYYPLLFLFLPLLRKFISARACAMLWLIPNFLYIVPRSALGLPNPPLVITTKSNLVWILSGIWFLGFVAVMIWKCGEHLIFRHQILRNARPVTDPEILRIWKNKLEYVKFKRPRFRLLTSVDISSPLTIGVFNRSICVVLPEKPYTTEELQLILLHELVHIGRQDAGNKFFMVFCSAMCWFNPLMWIAMRKSAEDLELSCDETVLLYTTDTIRKRYATLLLDTAGDERGFTSCLSVTAKSMRYRLKSITKAKKKRSGALIVGLFFFLLYITSGFVTLAYNGNTGKELVYHGQDYSQYSIHSMGLHDGRSYSVCKNFDEEALHEYIAGLTLYEVTGNYSLSSSKTYLSYYMDTPYGSAIVILNDNVVTISPRSDASLTREHFYIPEGVDWSYLKSIIHPQQT